ncbi:LamG domain-containing protein [Bacteroidota bacterium]
MKNSKCYFGLVLTVFLGFIFVGCQEGNSPIDYNSTTPQNQINIPTNAFSTNLLAGQTIDAGDIKVWNDQNFLYVQYLTMNNWWLNASHLHVATSLAGIPQTSSGNPKVGNFDYQAEYNPHVQSYTYTIPITWNWQTELFIAAHSEVVLKDVNGHIIQQETAWGQGNNFPGNSWAMYFNYTIFGPDCHLVAYYPFNGNANDESGMDNHGTVNGATLTKDRFDRSDKAYFFDGNDFIDCGNGSSLQIAGNITVTAWVNFPIVSNGKVIISKHDFNQDRGWLLEVSPKLTDIGIPWFSGRDGTGSLHRSGAKRGTQIVSYQWYFLVGQRQGSTWKIYINGELNSQRNVGSSGSLVNLSRLTIGAQSDNHGLSYFKGVIDDIRIYDYAISLSDINELYHEGGW